MIGDGILVSIAGSNTYQNWAYKSLFAQEPISDEFLHIVVIDTTGKFSGIAGTVLEKYQSVSKAT